MLGTCWWRWTPPPALFQTAILEELFTSAFMGASSKVTQPLRDLSAGPVVLGPPIYLIGHVKHWRAFGPDEWRYVRNGVIGLLLGGMAPIVVFYAGYRALSFSIAVIAVLFWSAGVFVWHRHRTGSSDVFSAGTFVMACVNALIGLIFQNPILYLVVPSVENIAYATVLLCSALVGRPLIAVYACRLYPVPLPLQRTPAFRRVFLVVSAVWFLGLLLRSAVRLWLLSWLPLESYLVINTGAGWLFSIFLIVFTIWYPSRELRRAGLFAHP